MAPLARSASALAGTLFLALLIAPGSVSGQEKTPIGGEWADFDCPMPVAGLPSNHLPQMPVAPLRKGNVTAPGKGQSRMPAEMPLLSSRCFNPLAMTIEAPRPDHGERSLLEPFGRPADEDPFGLDGALGARTDGTFDLEPRPVAPQPQPPLLRP